MNKNKTTKVREGKNKKQDARMLRCSSCGAHDAVIHKYGLNICRRCFREVATHIGFEKYN